MKPALPLVGVLSAAALFLCVCETFEHPQLTKKLWDNAAASEFNEPASPPQVKAFQAATAARVLIAYDEYRERNGSVRRRAFCLPDSAKSLAAQRKPNFTNPTPGAGWTEIPVLNANDAKPGAPLYLQLTPDQKSFTLVRAGVAQGPYPLPTYDDGGGFVLRVAATPFALVGDVAVVAGMLGWLGLWGLAH